MTAARPDTWMPIYWGDYIKDTADLNTKEHGVYLLLLGWYWTNGGALDDDRTRLARAVRLDDENDPTLTYILERFFRLSRGKWRQKRADFELKKATSISEARKKAGKNGGLASGKSRSKNEANVQANTQAKRTPSQSPSQSQKEDNPPVAPLKGGAQRTRGHRLPDDWTLTSERQRQAVEARQRNGLPAVDLRLEAEKFANHWRSKGSGATKLDWDRAWLNWALKSTPSEGRGRSAPQQGNGFVALIHEELEHDDFPDMPQFLDRRA